MPPRRYSPVMKARPGQKDWPGFCDWVRAFLWYDRATGLIRYRPRTPEHFHWLDDPELAAREWNAANANRAVRPYRAGRYGAFVRIDGARALWANVRVAMGQLGKYDPNIDQPDPRDMTDAEVVARWGIDYAISRRMLLAQSQAEEVAREEKAIARLEERYGRRLSLYEKAIATGKIKIDSRGVPAILKR